MLDLEALFAKHEAEFIKFDREQNPRHPRRDVCAFLLLHELAAAEKPGRTMVEVAEYDEIWLDADVDTVAEKATEEQIVTLIRCGVETWGTDPIKRSKESVIYFLSCDRRDALVLPGVVLHRSEPHCFSPSRNLAG